MPSVPSNIAAFVGTPSWPWVLAGLLGLGLAASSGLRAFLPLLLLSGAAKWNLFSIHLGPEFAWLTTDTAFYSLAIATVVEMAGDKIPAVDHALDVIGTVIRPVAGALVAAAALSGGQMIQDPTIAAILGLAVGAPLAFGLHAAKAGTRGASSATTLGVANPLLSIVEDIAAVFISLLAILAPILVPVILALAFLLVWQLFKTARRFRRRAVA